MANSTKAPKTDPATRPGAGGHRFGPDLQCNECGRNWDEHQHDPSPCSEAADRCDSVAPIDAGLGTGDETDAGHSEPVDDDADDAGDDRDSQEDEDAF